MKAKKAALGKESWGHGVTEVPKYTSVNSHNFIPPPPAVGKEQNKREVAELKARIGSHNFSYGNNALTHTEHLANYNSSTAVAHKVLGSANIDTKMINEQRIKLTKSNF